MLKSESIYISDMQTEKIIDLIILFIEGILHNIHQRKKI